MMHHKMVYHIGVTLFSAGEAKFFGHGPGQAWIGPSRGTGPQLHNTKSDAQMHGVIQKLCHRAFRIRFETWNQASGGRDIEV